MTKIDLTKSKVIFDEPLRITGSQSWEEHIPFAFFLMEALKPRVFVELGVHTGNSYFAFCQAIKKLDLKTKCYGVDTWQGDKQAGFYGEDIFTDVVNFNEKYGKFSALLRMYFDEALNKFKDASIDLLHIDGLHTYQAVKHDLENWLPKISCNGIVLLHDTQVKRDDFGVWKLWKEISNNYPSFEFKHGNGLGILAAGKKADKSFIRFLYDLNNDRFMVNLFSKLGASVMKGDLIQREQNENNRLNELLLQKEQSLIQKEETIKQKEATITDKDTLIRRFDGIIKDQSLQISRLDRSLAKIEASFSFKAANLTTRPLATIRNYFEFLLIIIKDSFLFNRNRIAKFPEELGFRGYLDNPGDNAHCEICNGWFVSKKPLQKVELFIGDRKIIDIERNIIRKDVDDAHQGYVPIIKKGFEYTIPDQILFDLKDKKRTLFIRFYIDDKHYIDEFHTKVRL